MKCYMASEKEIEEDKGGDFGGFWKTEVEATCDRDLEGRRGVDLRKRSTSQAVRAAHKHLEGRTRPCVQIYIYHGIGMEWKF
ncbi:hypothetical protein I3843_Q044800 [Carya illinoinensis]|uniref:Uncharacterized protein n=1 Tax=Carya illinoinensis TaxID=32201 RepID=A0A922F4Z4_CARIL|nr:hypothetical protein I3843_Q044800 [Carya illinoinensis]KAG6714190.1 hypothetical protein I3842_05G191900 [Carya illinoinensis]